MRSVAFNTGVVAALAASAYAQSSVTAPAGPSATDTGSPSPSSGGLSATDPGSSSPSSDAPIPPSDVSDLLTAIAGPTATPSLSPEQLSKLGSDLGNFYETFNPGTAFDIELSSFVDGKSAPTLAPALSSSVAAAISAVEDGNPAALTTLAALVSTQPFASDILAQATAEQNLIFSASNALASIFATDASVSVPSPSPTSTSSSALAAAPTAGAGVVGAAVAAAAGVVGIALL